MDYITAAEAAEKWGVTPRQVQRLLAAGRIPGAKKYGRAFMIPDGAEKPGDPRFEVQSAKTLATTLEEFIAATADPLPKDDPDAALDLIPEQYVNFRLFVESYIAYMRGDYERSKECYRNIAGDEAIKLRASTIATAAAVSSGDYSFFQEVEAYCKGIIKTDMGALPTAVAEWALANAYVGAFAPEMIPNWIKEGDFSAFPVSVRMDAMCVRMRYLYSLKKYESVLDAVSTALLFEDPRGGLPYASVYLRVMYAVACYALGRLDEARDYLRRAMRDCLPVGFIAPLIELSPRLGGLLEQILEREYPAHYDSVIGQAKIVINHWVEFHNLFTKDNFPFILSPRENHIAQLTARGVPDAEIAEQFHISVGRLKAIKNEIYSKLYVKNRKELSRYIF